jgi:hypothetical protein
MNWAKVKLPAVTFAVLCLASYVVFLEVEASEDSDEQIGESAIWDPAPAALLQMRQNCGSQAGDYSSCFIEQMFNFNAPADAVAFTQTYADQNRGKVALLKEFHALDAVDLGYVSISGEGGVKQGWLLLNGTPAIIDVDNVDLLPQSAMTKSPGYDVLRRRHKQVALFGGDRTRQAMPAADSLPDGGQGFTVDYPLKDGCPTCAVLGQATFKFEFDPTGKLAEVKFLEVRAAGR